MRTTLEGGLVVASLDPPVVDEADVVVDGGRIAEVVERGGRVPPGGRRIDCSGCLVIPGNVCAHTHLYSSLARGMPYALDPPESFVQILQRIWWRLDRALDEEAIRASALVGGAEALLAGTTTLVDHHASPNAIEGSLDVVADALAEIGIRSVLCYEVSDRDGGDRAEAGLKETERFLSSLDDRPLARGMVGAHASFTLSEETLAGCVETANAFGVGVHVHVAEDAADEADAEARFGVRVVERLADAGALTDRSLLAHCVHLDRAEIGLVREAGATVAHNPRSNMNNAVGRTPVGALGPRVALGTDGIGADMFEESRAGFFRLREDDLDAPFDRPLRWLAEGARVAGRAFGESDLGLIEPGAPADLVVLDYAPRTPLHEGTLAGHWTFGLASSQVREVLVAGEVVVRDGRLARVDQDDLFARAEVAAEGLWSALEGIGPHPFAPEGA